MKEVNNPYVQKLDSINYDIKNIKKGYYVKLTHGMNFSKASLGFHSFFSRTRESLEAITKKENLREEIYMIVNPYEFSIEKYDDDLNNKAKKITKHSNQRTFYELWELLYYFGLGNDKKISLYTNSKEAGIITDTVKDYRKHFKYSDKSDSYNSKKASLIILNDLVQEYENSPFIEQESYELLLSEILDALKHQDKKGNLILKVFDTFTDVTLKMLYVLGSFYSEMHICKPLMSRMSNSQKYIICQGFKGCDDTKILEDTLKQMKSKEFVFDIFESLELPKKFVNTIRYSNIYLMNNQQILINDIIVYIKHNDFFGDEYHRFKNNQIERTKEWGDKFFGSKNKNDDFSKIVNYNKKEEEQLTSKLI